MPPLPLACARAYRASPARTLGFRARLSFGTDRSRWCGILVCFVLGPLISAAIPPPTKMRLSCKHRWATLLHSNSGSGGWMVVVCARCVTYSTAHSLTFIQASFLHFSGGGYTITLVDSHYYSLVLAPYTHLFRTYLHPTCCFCYLPLYLCLVPIALLYLPFKFGRNLPHTHTVFTFILPFGGPLHFSFCSWDMAARWFGICGWWHLLVQEKDWRRKIM